MNQKDCWHEIAPLKEGLFHCLTCGAEFPVKPKEKKPRLRLASWVVDMNHTDRCDKCGQEFPIARIFVDPLDVKKRVCEGCFKINEAVRLNKILGRSENDSFDTERPYRKMRKRWL